MRLHLQEQPIARAMPLNPPPPDRFRAPADDASADEREFEAFAQGQDPLDIEAATWVTRCRNGLSAQDEAELQAWLDADPRHAEAFADMDATFDDVQQLPDDDVAVLKSGLLPQQAIGQQGQPRLRDMLRGWGQLFPHVAAAAMAFTLVGGSWMGWHHWRQLPTFEQSYATARGQQLSATLPDGSTHANAFAIAEGSTLQLDTATRAVARLYRDRREVHLTDGQAMFTVKSDAERPFHVWVGGLRITVVGTRFSVRHTPSGLGAGQTIVSVEKGRVQVTKAGNGDQMLSAIDSSNTAAVELIAGQMVVADSTGHLSPVASVPASNSNIAPWLGGRISFDQTPLAEAIAEFERYGRTGLVVRDPAVAALPVGGSYSLKHWQRFIEALPQVLPVRLVQRGEATEVVAQ